MLNVAGDNPDLRVSWCGYAEKRCNEDGPNIKPHGQSLQGLKTKSYRNLRARGSGWLFAFNPEIDRRRKACEQDDWPARSDGNPVDPSALFPFAALQRGMRYLERPNDPC